jgi:Na+/phosphate symporter
MKKLLKETKQLGKEVKKIKENIHVVLKKFDETEIESGHFYVQVIDYLKEMTNSLRHIVQPAFNHLDNNHPLDKEQTAELVEFNDKTSEYFNYIINLLKNRDFENQDELISGRDEITNMINEILRNRIKILKKTQKGAKVSVTYIEMLTETKNLLLHVVQLVKANISLLSSFTIVEPRSIEEEVLD